MVLASRSLLALLCCVTSVDALRREDAGGLQLKRAAAGTSDLATDLQLGSRTSVSVRLEELLRSACQSGLVGVNEVYPSPAPRHKYTIIGGGAFGTVSLREDTSGRRWAVKHLYKHALEDFETQELAPLVLRMPFNSVLREAFVKVADNGTLLEANFVMPAYLGGSLYDRYIRERKMDQPKRSEARVVLAQMVSGLWEMHQRGMLHSDVKLDNMMFASEGSLKLVFIDYGLTQTGCSKTYACSDQCAGSRPYMSPSVCRETYSYEADFWAWGIAVMEIFKGKSFIRVSALNHISLRTYQYRQFDDWAGKTKNPWAPLLRLIFRRPGAVGENLAWQREAMSGPRPEDHPILGHPAWLQGSEDELPKAVFKKDECPLKKAWRKVAKKDRPAKDFDTGGKAYKAAIRRFWAGICQAYASEEARPRCRAADDETPRPTSATVQGLCPSEEPNDSVHIDFSR